MLDGLRSRWTTPASCTLTRPSASAAPIRAASGQGSGPSSPTRLYSEGPGTYAVASQGRSVSMSEPTTRAVQPPLIREAAAISRAKRVRNSASSASSARISLSATRCPLRSEPR